MKDQEFNFDSEFMTDAEVEEALDFLVTTIGDEAVSDDSKTAVINPYRMQQIIYTYKVLKYLAKGTKAKVTYTLHEPYRSVGCVSVIGSDLMFSNSEWFLKAIELASNFEAYPKTNGTVQMNFTFHGLTRTVQ